jgi:hypothetical protein
MMDRQRRNELLRKVVAAVALIACVSLGVGMAVYLGVQIISGHQQQPTGPSPNALTSRPQPPPPENLKQVQLRPVQEVRSPDECPPVGQTPAVSPSAPLTTCDLPRTAAFVLGPRTMDLQLTHVETQQSPTSEFWVVRITMQPQSGAAFAAYTARHVNEQVAFVCDGIVVFAPKITQVINSAGLEISGNLTEQQANDIAALLRNPE